MSKSPIVIARLSLLCAVVSLFACESGGGGGGAKSSVSSVNKPSSSSNSVALSSSSVAVSSVASSTPSNAQKTNYCGKFTVANTSAEANTYLYRAPETDCFGIADDAGARKEIPLEMGDGSQADGALLQVSANVKLYNNYLNPLNKVVSFAVEITNNSEVPYCSVKFADDLSLYNDKDEKIATIFASNINGDLYGQSATGSNRDSCIGPHKTRIYSDNTTYFNFTSIGAVSKEQFAAAVRAKSTGLSARAESRFVLRPDLAPQDLVMDVTRYPQLTVSFVNNLGYAIKLEDDAMRTDFFDENGYNVGFGYVWLYEALGVDASDLKPEDFIIENGERFSLRDDILDLAAVVPATAKVVRIYLDWVPVQ